MNGHLRPGHVRRGAFTATFVVGALAVLTVPSAAADPGPAGVIERARSASADTTIAGTIEVQWLEDGRYHVERAGARADGTSFIVGRGDRRAVGTDGVRWLPDAEEPDTGEAVAWGSAPTPDPDAAWDLDLGRSSSVAGRAAIVVRARDEDGAVRARFFVDEDTDVLLRRDVLDRDGTVIRSVRFTQIRLAEGSPAVPSPPTRSPAVPQPPSDDDGSESFPAPEHLDPGFRLLGRYLHPDGAIQLFYADGLFSLSVFEQAGVVDWSSIPAGGVRGEVGGNRAHTFATATGTVVVWGTDDVVLTAISDAPPDAVAVALEGVKASRGFFPRAADFVLGPFGWD
ncbi:MAG TPA: sigma-E factor regulatory protein RseB domain-containing protein [Acidimicrobiia bacterium]|nr:sigma-E factor regulatory protein RseB domain-containing protein [Acidimicrobiia bacterium]